MSSKAESARFVLARQLPEIRARVGLGSAQELADRVKRLGGRLDRAAISKIESRTRNVSLDEALLLALALNVAPVHLFLPRDDEEEVTVAGGSPSIRAADARAWLRGVEPLSSVDDRTFRTEVPSSEWERRSQRLREAERAYAEAKDLHAVARAKLDAISRDLSELDNPMATLRSQTTGIGSEPTRRLVGMLDAAYDRVAETQVDVDNARRHLGRVRDEERVDDDG